MWLSWSDNSTGESGYRVYRATRNGRWDLISEALPDVTNAADPTATGAVWYRYRVTAFDPSGESPPSNEALVYAAAPPSAPRSRAPGASGCLAAGASFEWSPVREASA